MCRREVSPPVLRNTLLGVVVGAVAALCLACGATTPHSEGAPTTTAGAPSATTTTSTGYTLTIDRLGIVETPLEPVGLNPDHTIAVPPVTEPGQAAVYNRGPMPGQVGPTIVLGHVNGSGRPGVFARLADLHQGDTIHTTAPDGAVTAFRVYRTAVVDKDDYPTHDVYSDTPGPELRLITCGGELDRSAHNYLGQVIVWARQV
jgi:hypothetical protein